MPRNQLSAISGLSNPYIRELEMGNISNVRREKLISLAVALNLDLNETDNMLNMFDRTGLTADDIPVFLNTTRERRITSALLPMRHIFTYELMSLSMEQIPGPHVVVIDCPTACLRPRGHRTYENQQLVRKHPLYAELLESIGMERRKSLVQNLAKYPVDLYICKICLEKYIHRGTTFEERDWRAKHIENMIGFLDSYDNFNVYLTNSCSYFIIAMKSPVKETKESAKLFYHGRIRHPFPLQDRHKRLFGFATDNKQVIKNFKEELETVKNRVEDGFADKKNVQSFLLDLVHTYRSSGSSLNQQELSMEDLRQETGEDGSDD